MTKTMLMVGGGIVIVVVVAIAVLSGLNRDPSQLIAFLADNLIPTIVALASAYIAAQARDYAKKTEHNTNGRLGELVQLLKENGVNPVGYEDVTSDEPNGHDGMGDPPQ